MGISEARLVLGREIRRAVTESGKSAQELGDELGVSRQAIYRWMGGDVPIDRLDAVAEATHQQLVIRIGDDEKAAWPEWARRLDDKLDLLLASAADPLTDVLHEALETAGTPEPDEDPASGSSTHVGEQ